MSKAQVTDPLAKPVKAARSSAALSAELEYVRLMLSKLRNSCAEIWNEASFMDIRREVDDYFSGYPHFVHKVERKSQQATRPLDWSDFDAMYKRACETSQPNDWMHAALLAQQIRHMNGAGKQ
jgi:predicted transcriptional regulator